MAATIDVGDKKTEKKSAAVMLEEYKFKQHKGHVTRDEKREKLRILLAARSAHLPDYSWCADWVQWMRNNHPLLGMCLKYKENPIGIGQRIIILIGSISFGLAATNLVYLFYKINQNANGTVIRFETNDNNYDDSEPAYEITYEMVALWTVGSLLHSLIDLGVWHLSACSCCLPGACCSCCGWLRTFGRYITITLAGIFVALATSAVIMRANFEESIAEDGTSTTNSLNALTELEVEVESFSFLTGYFVELTLVYFVYYPIMATVFFSGAVRPCIPCIGGRPKEIERQYNEKFKVENKNKEESSEEIV